MKQKIQFLRLIWRVLTNKEQGWIFFRITKEQEKNYFEGKKINFDIRFFGVDKKIIQDIATKISISNKKINLN